VLPILFHIPLFGWSIPVPTYGVILAAAFLLILQVATRLARRQGIDPRDMLDMCFTVFLAGLVGAKLLLIILDWRLYLANPGLLPGVLRSAGVFYGGLLLAIPTTIWFARSRRLPLWQVADVAAVLIPIGLALGRLGCFAAGCCYGRPCTRPWAVTFTDAAAHDNTGVPLGIALHPTQLYQSLNGLLLALALYVLFRRKRYDGQVFLWFLALYGLTRSFWEIFRGDTVRGFLVPGWISTSQAIGLTTAVVALALLPWRRRAGGRKAA
jgi:phosphatidylglycerol:prolipoprotein diacylglycerol transferase